MKTTTKISLGLACPLLASALIAPTSATRAQGVAERAGQVLDDVGRNVRRGVENAFARTRVAVDNQGVIARVYSRLHWDKTLVGSTLELEVQDGGTAILRGTVADASARQRAVVLTRDTVGVTQVVDELTVLPPPQAIPATPATPATPAESSTPVIKP